MSEPYIGEIKYSAFNFAQMMYAFCNGTLLDSGQNSALYALIGTQFGNTTATNFRLPDLCGRAVVGPGIAPLGTGNTDWTQGATSGVENFALTLSNYPSHTHALNQLAQAPTTGTPTSAMNFTQFAPAALCGVAASAADTFLSSYAVSNTGAASPVPHENRQPFLALNPCIAIIGIFPDFS